MATISASVGLGGANIEADVLVVQQLLNACVLALGLPLLVEDGGIGSNTILAIQAYQAKVIGLALPDGRIDPGGKTFAALAAGTLPKTKPAPAIAATGAPLSGAGWWDANQARFPNSVKRADLAPPFRQKVIAFTDAMTAAGADVSIGSTLRDATRAKLMLYCWEVAFGERTPGDVPAIPGCAIEWDHGDLARSKRAAREMVDRFRLARRPSRGLSRHILGRAIDMTIGWAGTIKVKDATGQTRNIGAPRSGENNAALHAVGASYGVIKFAFPPPEDPPHWSDDGH